MGVRVREWDGGKNGQKAWWIFINHQGKRKAKRVGPGPMTPNSFYPTYWKPLFDAVIAYRHLHVLRHTYATQLLWQGQSSEFVKEQLGHSSIRITVDLYGHAIRSSDKSAMDQLDDPGASLRKSDASNDIRGPKLIKGGLA